MVRSKEEIKEAVRKHYGDAISKTSGSCCAPKPVELETGTVARYVELAGYTEEELAGVPETATTFGCGNPVNFIDVKPGQTLLDLGSGAGLDLILASRKVGPRGKVIGLDMTPQMIDACKKNLTKAGVTNFDVRLGEMEQMPVADAEVDWIISNCVINLSPDKETVFSEAFRVLKPGGRMLVSDIVTNNLPEKYRNDLSAWVGCIAGAVEEDEYIGLVRKAGFIDVNVVDRLVYTEQTLDALANDYCGCGPDGNRKEVPKSLDKFGVKDCSGRVSSIKLSARKPA